MHGDGAKLSISLLIVNRFQKFKLVALIGRLKLGLIEETQKIELVYLIAIYNSILIAYWKGISSNWRYEGELIVEWRS